MLPNLIVIGAMKCGTSSLHYYLDQVEGVFMSVPKEVDFFRTPADFEKGTSWYASHFPGEYAVRGESSPNYTKRHLFPGVTERIVQVVPRAKFIYLVRDPIKRAVSHYLHNVAHGREQRPPEAALTPGEDNMILPTGRYAYQLQPYLDRFSRDQILILVSEDLNNRRLETVNTALAFLGLPEERDTARFARMRHQTSRKVRYTGAGRLVVHSSQRLPLARFLAGFKPLKKLVRALLPSSPLPAVTLSPDLKNALVAYYREDVRQLEQLLGRSLAFWFDS